MVKFSHPVNIAFYRHLHREVKPRIAKLAKYHSLLRPLAIASGYNGNTFYSTDGGQTWAAATGIPAVSGFVVDRVELAYSRSNPLIVYASVDNSSGQIYRSLDAGHSYTLRNTGNNFLSGQGWYDNVVWADPINTNTLMVGGTDIWRSTDGGATITDIGGYTGSIHPDQHAIVAHPLFNGTTIRTVWIGNDGGLFRATDAYTASRSSGWTNLNHNLGITQFYGAAGNSNTLTIVGGTQDNGTIRYTTAGGPQGWTSMFGGDGGNCAADSTNSNYFYGEYVDLQIHRSANGGATASYIYSGITDAGSGSTANFIAPFILDPNNPNTMLAGGVSLWRSTNVKAATPTWAAIKASISSPISAIAVAPGNSDVIVVGHNNGSVYFTANGTAATPTWSLRSTGIGRTCTSIAISPSNSAIAYVTYGGYNSGNVLRTINSGASWANIAIGLPAAPMNSVIIAPTDTNTLYVGSDVGVYGTSNGGTSWSTSNDGPANVAVDQFFWMGKQLIAVTHGRGIFSTVPSLGPARLTTAGFVLNDGNANNLVDPNECSQLYLFVKNTNGITASNVTAVLTTTTPGVTIMQGASGYPNIALSTTATNLTPFSFNTSSSYACGTSVALTLTMIANGLTNVFNYSLPSAGAYLFSQTNGAVIVPGTTDTGNHGDNTVTAINLPFPVTFFGRTFTNANLIANGNLQFLSANFAAGNICLPAGGFNYAICPFWTDLRTDIGGEGIYTSVSGEAPNRVFYIEWRAELVSTAAAVDFEIALYESQQRVDMIYGPLGDPGSTATVGLQSDTGSSYTNYQCSTGSLIPGLQLSYQWQCNDGGGQCAPVANFTANPVRGATPLTVAFANSSLAASSYSWDFGDGNSSSVTNPTNTYSAAGTYSVTLTAVGGGGTNVFTRSSYIVVTNAPPSITGQPQSQVVALGSPASFSVTVAGTPPLAFQWRLAGAPISGATDTTYALAGAQCADAGGYDVVVTNLAGSTTSSVAVLTVQAQPLLVASPTNVTVLVGQTAGLAVIATTSCGGLSYQWLREGTNIPGASSSAYIRANAQVSDSGNYSVLITNVAGSATSAVAVVTVLAPPQIATPPTSLAVATGSNANFTVSATGSSPLGYQWRYSGVAIGGATGTTFTRTNAQCADAGGYDVVASNLAGSVTSSVAILTMVAPPSLTAQPTNLTVTVGQTATFLVAATNDCGGSLTYQWWFQSTNILTAATNAVLIRPNAQFADAGGYAVVVSNLAGSVTSTVATLTVLLPAQLVVTPPNLDFGVILTGATAKASFVVSNAGGVQLNGTAAISGGPFAFTDGSDGGLLLAPFSSTILNLAFVPPTAGSFSNAVTFVSTGGNSTNSIAGRAVETFAPTILAPTLVGTDFTFSFQSLAGKTYIVQYKDDLQNESWTTLLTIPGDGSLKTIVTPVAAVPQRFYRLSLQ